MLRRAGITVGELMFEPLAQPTPRSSEALGVA
jgi:hypothetical protein